MSRNAEAILPSLLTTPEVLSHEYGLIWGDDEATSNPEVYRRKANANGQAALCLSGGGTRSAAFSLGILQALSVRRILTDFHYLSTVSGGGYIGGWLQRWIHEQGGQADVVMAELASYNEPHEVKRLRQHFSPGPSRAAAGIRDVWAEGLIFARNILANWLLLGPLLVLLALIPKTAADFLSAVAVGVIQPTTWAALALVGAASLLLAVTTATVIGHMPTYGSAPSRLASDGRIWRMVVLPLAGWSLLGAFAMTGDLLPNGPIIGRTLLTTTFTAERAFEAASMAGVVFGLGIGFLRLHGPARRRAFAAEIPLWLASALVIPLGIALGAALFTRLAPFQQQDAVFLLVIFAPPWLIGLDLLAITLFVVLRARARRTASPEADRQTLAHLSATISKAVLIWAVAAAAALYLISMVTRYVAGLDLSVSGLLGFGSTAIAALGGRSSARATASDSLLRFLPLQPIVALATMVSAAMLFIIPVYLADLFVDELGKRLPQMDRWQIALALALVLGLLLYLLARRIHINQFSLCAVYRTRLVRLFLGSARRLREPDLLTGFDPNDDVRLRELAPTDGKRAILYPILNAAMNVKTANIGPQSRTAEPFFFSPLYCGSGMLSREGQASSLRTGAFLASSYYADQPDAAPHGEGVTLGAAIAISGTAADRAIGYHPSPLTAFLMTLMSARLGAWLPNPARASSLKQRVALPEPTNPLRALLSEIVGATGDSEPNLYLSDGGHFENLGLYEMIRRRCRYIVVADAGLDRDGKFFDLGNAVRKVKIDFEVDISFLDMRIASRGVAIDEQSSWALGHIQYPEGGEGCLLYLKPSFFGTNIPVDILSYAAEQPDFPHETTGDLAFTDAQFESYRKLGFTCIADIGGTDPRGIADFFEAVQARSTAGRTGTTRSSRTERKSTRRKSTN